MIIQIVILAVIAAFLGMKLYSVLGKRHEGEEESIPKRFEEQRRDAAQARPALAPARQLPQEMPGVLPAVESGVRSIAAADRQFDITAFLEGAKGAYGMILEAFWTGDRETLRELCDEDVYAGFDAAIAAREEAGETLDNTLVRIEDAKIDAASLVDRTARIRVRFVSDIAAVTRDRDGNVVAGSLDDAIESVDVWTFKRDVRSEDPDWLLDETDQG
ncbi:Tim44/TimA family putative adaptor protein [Qipengyuania sp. JC766]|uniref:Tim44/TimA family putative adaptor protein n=1 Tax=Qipengyuania sp. JC766 TaxID=3232139 RepID=UPI003457BA16